MATRTERLIVARTHHAAFVEKYPFHTSVISRMRPLVDPTIETMGVSMDQGSLLLHVNERWADAHADMFVGLLLHEVHHVVLGHLVDARLREVDAPDLMDIALECAANEHIVELLPNPILWQHFERAGFRANQSSVERYGILRAHVEANSSSRTLPLPGPSDAHEGLRKPVDSASMALQRRIVEELVELAESRAQPDDATIAGWKPGDLHRALFQKESSSFVDWRRALALLLARSSRTVSSYRRPSRRFPDRVGEVPGRMRQHLAGTPPRLVVCLDTSASMNDDDLADAARELRRLAPIARITLVTFDAQVHAVSPYRGEALTTLVGGGGTDFRLLFGPGSPTYGAEAAVVFTDGLGPFPEKPPAVPTLWVLASRTGLVTPPFGHTVCLRPDAPP